MMIFIECPCGAHLRATDLLAGRRVKCPKCAELLDIARPLAVADPASVRRVGWISRIRPRRP